ncbi:hypothetical protein ACVILK_000711 [Bradyrhizobium embrapense]
MLNAAVSFFAANPPMAGFAFAAIYSVCWLGLAPFLYAPAKPRRLSIRRRARRSNSPRR